MEEKFIPIKTKKETGKIYLEDIIYLEKNLQKLIIYASTREVQIYCKMDDIKPYLDERFLFCHRSYSFNMDKVVSLRDQTIYLEKQSSVPLGRETFRKAKRLYEEYMGKKETEKYGI